MSAITVNAASNQNEPATKTLLKELLPLLIIVGIIFFLFKRLNKKNGSYLDRGRQHMDRLEEQNDEIISLLKELTEKNKKESEQEDGLE